MVNATKYKTFTSFINGYNQAKIKEGKTNVTKTELKNMSKSESNTIFDWIIEGIQEINDKNKTIKEKTLSSIFNSDNLFNKKPKEILRQIQSKSIFGYGAVQAAKSVVSVVSDLAEINFSRYTRLSEDYMANNSISLVKNAVGQVTSFVSSVGSAAMAGAAVGGLPGAVVSSAIAAATYGVSSWVQTKEAESKFYQTLNASKSQSAFSLQRAGLTDGGRGTEN